EYELPRMYRRVYDGRIHIEEAVSNRVEERSREKEDEPSRSTVEVAKGSAARLFDQANESWVFSMREEAGMATLARPGVPLGGFKTDGQIHATNDLVFHRNQNAMGVAVELLSTHTPGAPVVDERGEFIGFVSEFDILRALEAKKDLNRLTAGDVMAKD